MGLYNIYHVYDVDGGFGDAVEQKDFVGFVEATDDEVVEFLAKWDKPEVYDRPYSDLYHHHVVAEKVKFSEITRLVPYESWKECGK